MTDIKYNSKTCRACLMENTDSQSLFNIGVSEVFKLCTSLEINKNDEYPKVICSFCLSKCYSWFHFKEQCLKNEAILKQQIYTGTLKEHLKNSSSDTQIRFLVESQHPVELVLKQKEPNNENLNKEKNHLTQIITKDIKAKFQESEDGEKEDESSYDIKKNNNRTKKTVERRNCDKCEKTFRKQETLEAHYNLIHLGQKAVTCNLCTAGFSNIGNLKRHNMLQHSEQKHRTHACNECKKIFSFSSSLSKHMRIHQNIRSFICDICGKTFIHKTGLQSHLLSHKSDKPFNCTICEKKFKTDPMLKIHLKRHNSLKKFICSECGKMFSTSGELTTHSRIHSGICPFSCERCQKSFKTISQLYVHMRSHSGKRPYSCDLCYMSFTGSEVLKHHRMIHTGEKPHQCNICKKFFRQRCALKTHMKTHNSK